VVPKQRLPPVRAWVEPVRAHLQVDPLAGEHGLDELVEPARHDERPVRAGERGEALAHAHVLPDPGDDLGQRGPHGAELVGDYLVQGQVSSEARLRLVVDVLVAELEEHEVETVHLGHGAVPVDHQPLHRLVLPSSTRSAPKEQSCSAA